MNTSQGEVSLKNPVNTIEWKLLAFLILFMDVKLVVKLLALVFIYFLQPDFRFGFRFRQSRLPLFYPLIIGIALVGFSTTAGFSRNYLLVLLSGLLVWMACILAVHQMKLFVERTDTDVLNNTLSAFFILNICFSLLNLLLIFTEIGLRNPFLYQGQYQKYFINTGDYIRGISFDFSTTNAMINCFGMTYFLFRNKYLPALSCLCILLLTGSNFGCAVMVMVWIAIFILKSNRDQKSIIAVSFIGVVLFFAKVSPQNAVYAKTIVDHYILKKKESAPVQDVTIPIRDRPDSLLTPETRNQQIAMLFLDSMAREKLKQKEPFANAVASTKSARPKIEEENINAPFYQSKLDTSLQQRNLLSYIHNRQITNEHEFPEGVSGKLLGFKQSVEFLKKHQDRLIAGDGIGNFSSKLAYKVTGLSIAGGFPGDFNYISPDFLKNHLSLYAYFFTKPREFHSLFHSPSSVYDQLLTEYGLAGLLAFSLYYVGFFLRNKNHQGYGLPMLAILLAFFLVDYWFEQLSVVVLFELLMFTNAKEASKQFDHD
jgi:hypothetical protein